ncbi:LAME_0G19460g1_1 [Lachancea meyersii CBS 8951]|uniref:LAME_0G19460g1_1 n=1 Tax=Lachancea meyersii CBS 8951 TaxID=1266667 RepID=A0A1G4KC79_9SACH|nr:LAME_0G19460g1_1 [Lachancea meyersii CBS 8951]
MDSNEVHEAVRSSETGTHQDSGEVIEIESCAEDEIEIQRASELRQHSSGPRRDRSGRFRPEQLRSSSSDGNVQDVNEDNDDLEVVNEVVVDDGGPLDPEAEYIDLDNEGVITVAQIRPRLPSMGTANNEDEDVVFLGQNTTNSSFVLNLPGGERLLITGSSHEQPIRRSFQNQVPRPVPIIDSSRSWRRRIERAAASARQNLSWSRGAPSDRQSIFHERRRIDESRQARNNRQLRQNARRQTPMSWTRHVLGHSDFASFQSRLSMLPGSVRAAFDEALSIDEFRAVLEARDRESYEQNLEELTVLYAQYREMVTNSNEQNLSNEGRTGRNSFNWAQVLGNYTGQNGPPYGLTRTWAPPHLSGYFGREPDEVRETQGIIEMIQAREELESDNRKRKLMESTKGKRETFLKEAKGLTEGYSASFDPTVKFETPNELNNKAEIIALEDDEANEIEVPACTICGVELGVGIPDDYAGMSALDGDKSFEQLIDKYHFHCPYQSLRSFSVADRDLSRRTFVASCGHMFCGRCFKRIDTARNSNKKNAKKLKEAKGPSNPDNYGPSQCPADKCRNKLRQKFKMTEVFF